MALTEDLQLHYSCWFQTEAQSTVFLCDLSVVLEPQQRMAVSFGRNNPQLSFALGRASGMLPVMICDSGVRNSQVWGKATTELLYICCLI